LAQLESGQAIVAAPSKPSLRRRIARRLGFVKVGLCHLDRVAGGQTPAVAEAAWAACVSGPFEKPLLGFRPGSSSPKSSPRVGLLLGVPTDAADPAIQLQTPKNTEYPYGRARKRRRGRSLY
jgi:hypothetical protein